MIHRLIHTITEKLPSPFVQVGLWAYANAFVPIFASGKQTYDLGGFRMNLNQNESTPMIQRRFKSYESEISQIISDSISKGDTYVDIGSNKGYHVLEAADIVGRSGTVYSFEPNPHNFPDLQENVSLNGFDNVWTYNLAVFDHNGEASFTFGEKSGQGSVSDEGEIEVKTTTFDSFSQEENISPHSIDFIKIDVEGGEASVLDGMKNFLSESENCQIIVEVHNNANIHRMSKILHENNCYFETLGIYWRIRTSGRGTNHI